MCPRRSLRTSPFSSRRRGCPGAPCGASAGERAVRCTPNCVASTPTWVRRLAPDPSRSDPARRRPQGHPSPPASRIRGLSHWFGDGDEQKQILFDIDFDVPAGEVVILTGPSGCGKTTLLSLIGGLRAVMKGSVQVLGRELFGASTEDVIATRRQTIIADPTGKLRRATFISKEPD